MEGGNKRKNIFSNPDEGEYVGNVFGWKLSGIGLALTAALVLYMVLGSRFGAPASSLPSLPSDSTRIQSPADSLSE